MTMTPRVTVSGSFRKHYREIALAIDAFADGGVEVLSPKKANIVASESEFIILDTDGTDDIRVIEQRHLEAIKRSDLLYVCNPGGYIGLTVAMELGWALANGVRVACSVRPSDVLLWEFLVDAMPVDMAVALLAARTEEG